MGSLVYFLYAIVDLCFVVHTQANVSPNPGRLHFEGLVHLLIYNSNNKKLGIKYYFRIDNAPLSNILVQARI